MLHSAKPKAACAMTDAQLSRPSVTPNAARVGCALLLLALSAALRAGELEGIQSLIDHGQFMAAETRIAGALARPALPKSEKLALDFERERMRRMRLDFTLTADEAQARL